MAEIALDDVPYNSWVDGVVLVSEHVAHRTNVRPRLIGCYHVYNPLKLSCGFRDAQ